jgi:signal transduction histidine kinase
LLLFPDGKPPSRRWRWIGWWSVTAIVVGAVAAAISGNPWSTVPIRSSESTVPGVLGSLMTAGFVFGSMSAIASVASLVVRYRRSSGVARSQIRWIALGGAFLVAFIFVVPNFETEGPATSGSELIGVVAMSALMASYGIAITKYRLYDIDIVISRTVTYGVLAAFITAVYALLVVGVGSLLGSGGEPNLALSIAAVAVVAIAFEPLRNRVQHAANRLVFGERASPYEVLSNATSRLAAAGSSEETLAQITRLVVEGSGASRAVLWLKIGGHLQPHAATPDTALSSLGPIALSDQQLPPLPGEAVVPVRHRNELLGAITITKPRGQPVTVADEKVLADVAAGSGLLLRNIGLNAELAERAEQLQLSRRRLVAAHDEERHRLERDLHDGAQQQVVALKVKLGIARTLAEREGAGNVADIVSDLATTTQEAVDAMRAVAHGIYPPLLEAEGLEVALTAVRRTFPVPVDIEFEGLGRYERSLEESVYFCIVEIITQAVDGGSSAIMVSLNGSAGSVEFTIRHDGAIGNLVAVEDRVEALGGRLQATSDATGNVVSGTLLSSQPDLEIA